MVATAKRMPTTDMQVTSIRLETDLKERLKDLSGNQGYQSLIRDILWDYVERHERAGSSRLTAADIRATVTAMAVRSEYCALTGKAIAAEDEMLMGWTISGQLVPLSLGCLS
jgi:predicted DNA-binding protein